MIVASQVFDSTSCHFCKRVGFVRIENVLTRGKAYRHFYCGACDSTWQIDASEPEPPPDPPNRSRTRSFGDSD